MTAAALVAHIAHDGLPKRGWGENRAHARAMQQTRSHRHRDGARYTAYRCPVCRMWHTRRETR